MIFRKADFGSTGGLRVGLTWAVALTRVSFSPDVMKRRSVTGPVSQPVPLQLSAASHPLSDSPLRSVSKVLGQLHDYLILHETDSDGDVANEGVGGNHAVIEPAMSIL